MFGDSYVMVGFFRFWWLGFYVVGGRLLKVGICFWWRIVVLVLVRFCGGFFGC